MPIYETWFDADGRARDGMVTGWWLPMVYSTVGCTLSIAWFIIIRVTNYRL